MSAPDTSTAAVEALAVWEEQNAATWSGYGALALGDRARKAAATLRALAEERDELAKSAEFWRECSNAFEHDWKRAEAERDAARAEVAALREALQAQSVWHEAEAKALSKQPQTSDTRWRRMTHREQIDLIAAALAGGPPA